MRFKMIAVVGLVSALAASPAFAFSGGGGHKDAQVSYSGGGAVSGTFDGGTFSGQCDPSGSCTGSVTTATSEPLALFAVGLGLLGARFLRRR
ncbi:MAG TPA: hypothetical protein VGT02_17365 [Methylomirabilota bacterium]|jgi:hypothetical protein|nr:hypothetical protein [Methylomirabilota bacterium]